MEKQHRKKEITFFKLPDIHEAMLSLIIVLCIRFEFFIINFIKKLFYEERVFLRKKISSSEIPDLTNKILVFQYFGKKSFSLSLIWLKRGEIRLFGDYNKNSKL